MARYLELAEDAEDLGEGSKYRGNPVVRDPRLVKQMMALKKCGAKWGE